MPNENFSKWIKPVQIFNAIELLTSEKSKFINGEIKDTKMFDISDWLSSEKAAKARDEFDKILNPVE